MTIARQEGLDALARSPIKRTKITIGRPIGEGVIMVPTPPKRDAPASLVWYDHTGRVSVAGDDQPPLKLQQTIRS